ncbi:MAG: endonuclease/exonuclease/phosphatase family protein [bacterium]|nr:endonuclease/exonuclease/phosphatase family protein [bacterium]
MRHARCAAALFLAALCAAGGCRSGTPAILIDGRFEDWRGIAPADADPSGDSGPSGVDFGRVWIADDRDTLFIRFETGKEISLQSGNDIVLYLDTDDSAATGLPVGGIGADLSWRFGRRRGTLHRGDSPRTVNAYEIGLVTAPTVTSSEFEIKFRKEPPAEGIPPLFRSGTVSWILRDEGDEAGDVAPDAGRTARARLRRGRPRRVEPGRIGREAEGHVRLVTWNVYEDNIFRREEEFARILRALDPDILCLQEIRRHGPDEVRALVTRMLGGAWHLASHIDCFTLSRHPIARTVPLRGAVGALIDLPDGRHGLDLFVVNAHLGSGTKDERRQREADEIVALLRDLKSPGHEAALPVGTPMIVTGDLNLVGGAGQLRTLLTGQIADEEAFGPSAPPDWDGTPMADLSPRHIAAAEVYTWVHFHRRGFGPGRLDYVIHTDSAASAGNRFVLCTASMPDADLDAAGLRRADTATASDHLPVVADFMVE